MRPAPWVHARSDGRNGHHPRWPAWGTKSEAALVTEGCGFPEAPVRFADGCEGLRCSRFMFDALVDGPLARAHAAAIAASFLAGCDSVSPTLRADSARSSIICCARVTGRLDRRTDRRRQDHGSRGPPASIGEAGELLIRTPEVMGGYWRGGVASELAVLRRHRWSSSCSTEGDRGRARPAFGGHRELRGRPAGCAG